MFCFTRYPYQNVFGRLGRIVLKPTATRQSYLICSSAFHVFWDDSKLIHYQLIQLTPYRFWFYCERIRFFFKLRSRIWSIMVEWLIYCFELPQLPSHTTSFRSTIFLMHFDRLTSLALFSMTAVKKFFHVADGSISYWD